MYYEITYNAQNRDGEYYWNIHYINNKKLRDKVINSLTNQISNKDNSIYRYTVEYRTDKFDEDFLLDFWSKEENTGALYRPANIYINDTIIAEREE